MLRLITFIFLCFFMYSLQGQQSVKKKKEPVVKSYITPTFSVYGSSISPGKYAVRVNEEMWRHASGWSSSIQYGMRVSKKVDFSTGLGYNLFQITQTDGFGYWVCDPGHSYADDIDRVERIIRMQTIQIPLEIRYKFTINKFTVYPVAGITTSYYLEKDQYVDFILNSKELVKNSDNDLVLDHNRTLNLSSHVKFGMSYSFNPQWKIKAEPFYSYSLGKDDLFNYLLKEYETVRISSFGMSLGIEYALKMTKQRR